MVGVHQQETVGMFPFMAQGHITPFLALALQIHQRTPYKIIFVNTPLNIKKLRISLPPSTSINLVELPFCSTNHGLPPDCENTCSLPYPLIGRLLEASESLKPSFDQLIEDITRQQQGRPPLCIIADMFLGWTVEVANRFNVFHTIFLTGSAYGSAIYFSMWLHLPHCKTDGEKFSLPDFPEVSELSRSQLANNLKNANSADSLSIGIQNRLRLWLKSDGMLINTIKELDQIGLNYFRRKMGKNSPIWPIVPLLYCSPNKTLPQKKSGVDLECCIHWLNNHSPNSVLFVSFGSQNTISSSQLMDLAIGLEASGANFIWVVRPPVGFDINGELRSEWLPKEFEERVKENNKGLIMHKWAPQLEILSHKATGAFLSHCGWNSTLESLSNGVPMIAWPLAAEQYYNAKMLEELGICIEVAKGNVFEVSHEKITGVIELVMGGTQKGKEMEKKAQDVKLTIEDAIRETDDYKGSSVKAIEEFIQTAFERKIKLDDS